jgi:hypothetical protein
MEFWDRWDRREWGGGMGGMNCGRLRAECLGRLSKRIGNFKGAEKGGNPGNSQGFSWDD